MAKILPCYDWSDATKYTNVSCKANFGEHIIFSLIWQGLRSITYLII